MEHSFDSLRRHLQRSFDPAAAPGLDAVMMLVAGPESLIFRVCDGRLDFDLEASVGPDATFTFADSETARRLLSGEADAFEAFMLGQFRSDGYLMWAFALMALFRSSSLPVNPTE